MTFSGGVPERRVEEEIVAKVKLAMRDGEREAFDEGRASLASHYAAHAIVNALDSRDLRRLLLEKLKDERRYVPKTDLPPGGATGNPRPWLGFVVNVDERMPKDKVVAAQPPQAEPLAGGASNPNRAAGVVAGERER